MAKCYLMMEDVEEGVNKGTLQFAMDMGVPMNPDGSQTLPDSVDKFTPAQETTWRFYSILKGMFDAQHAAMMKREVGSQVVMPSHVAEELRKEKN